MPLKERKNLLYIIAALIVIITMGIIIFIVRDHTNRIITELTLDRVQMAKQELVSYFDDLAARAMQRAELIANSEETINAIKSGDPENVKKLLREYAVGIDFVSLTDRNGVMLFRTYTEAAGDDVSAHYDVSIVLRTGRPSSSISLVPTGALAACASVPIYDGNEMIGIINCNFDLTKPEYVDTFKERTGCDVTLFIGSERVVTTVKQSGARITGTRADDSIVETVLRDGEQYVDIMYIFGTLYGAHYSPLVTGDRIIGMLFTGHSVESVAARQRVMNNWIIAAFLFAVASALIFAHVTRRLASKSAAVSLELAEKETSLNSTMEILQAMSTMILVADLQTDNIIFVNKKTEDAYGQPSDIKAKKCWELLYPGTSKRCDFCPKNKKEFYNGEPVIWESEHPATGRHYRIISQIIDWPDGSKVYLQQRDDITESVRANAIKRQADEYTQLLLDAVPICCILWDKDLKMLDCNQEVVKMFGVASKQEFIDRFTIFSPDYQGDGMLSVKKGPGLIKKALDEGYSRFEWMHQNLSGELIPAEVTCIRVKYRDEYTVTEYIRDLREQKAMMAADEKIREANERIQSIFDTTPLAITMWDPETFALFDCNLEAVRVVGLDDKKTYIEKFAEMSPEYQPNGQKTSEMIAQIFETTMREGACRYDWDQMAADGEVIPFYVNTVRLKHTDGYIVISYAQDMRETNAAIAKMREADERVQIMFDAVPFGASFWDEDLNLVDCNNEQLRLFNLSSKQEFIDRFYELSPEYQPDGSNSKDKAFELLTKALNQDYFRCEWVHQKMNGEPIPCEVIFVRVKYRGEYGLTAYIRDLSEHKAYLDEIEKAQESLRHARDAAETANRTKSAFLANMSHEIRTPMNSIIGFSELAQDDEISLKTREYLTKISESAKWLLNIINDILDISKIESGKVELERIPFDLHDIIAHCQTMIMPKTGEKGLSLYCYAEPSIGKKLLGDPVRIRQILLNLLSNAVKFTHSGTVKLLASIENSTGDSVTINFEVKDSGIGMTPEQITKVFEPFIQADDSVTRRFGGTGLGLAITKNIIELMGGTLSVESALGVGSRFSFTLTFDMMDDPANVSTKSIVLNDLEKPNFKGEVLICEDNDLNQQVICDHLARVGLKSVVANNGKEGVDIVAARLRSGEAPFDLIFMDIHMPVMDGLEAASKITALGIKTPIVALTANIMVNDLELYRKSGMNDYLGKPFVSQELWKCLVKYLPVIRYSTEDQSQMSNEEEKLQKRLKLNFVRNNQTKYAEIVKAAADGDIKLANRLAHTLKSNAGQIGEKALQKAAAQIEAAFFEGKTKLDENQMYILESELKVVLGGLAPLLAEAEAEAKKTEAADVEKVRAIIEKLEPLLINRNPSCEDLLDDIRTIPGAEELARQIEKFKFKQAQLELSNLKKSAGIE